MEPTQDMPNRTDASRASVGDLLGELRRYAVRVNELPAEPQARLSGALSNVAVLLGIEASNGTAAERLEQLVCHIEDIGPETMESRLDDSSRSKLVGDLRSCLEILSTESPTVGSDTDEAGRLLTVDAASGQVGSPQAPLSFRISERFELEAVG